MAQFKFTRRVDPHDVSLTLQLEDADFQKIYPNGSADPNDEFFTLLAPANEPSRVTIDKAPGLARLMAALLERSLEPLPPEPTPEGVDSLTSRLSGSADKLSNQ